MRTLLLALSVVLVLCVTRPCRAEFDSGGIGPAKLKPAATGFDATVAAKPRSIQIAGEGFFAVRLGLPPLLPRTPCCFPHKSTARYPSNIPRPKHGGLTPERVHGGTQ